MRDLLIYFDKDVMTIMETSLSQLILDTWLDEGESEDEDERSNEITHLKATVKPAGHGDDFAHRTQK